MRTVPVELAKLIPIDAHEGVASVVEDVMAVFPYWGNADGGPNLDVWMAAISIWNARQIVDIQRRLEPPPYEGG